ncbi:hypothetical protein, partial [Parasutterella excrementihominis]|uniref:hypothetical protein n=1 Tax=Parasutterella excrementihominis TaxID=487175 RepID=UPI003AB3F7E8
EEKHAKGESFQIGLITGASTGDSCDGMLTRAHAICVLFVLIYLVMYFSTARVYCKIVTR